MAEEETPFFTDDVALIYHLLQDNWSLDKDTMPTMAYKPEAYMMGSRVGSVYVYPISRQNTVSSTDYRTIQRTAVIGVKLANRNRERHFEWGQEIYRIVMANRRAAFDNLNGYYYIELTGDRQSTDLSGWYTTTFDLKLTTYVLPIKSAGFGKRT